MSPIYNVDNFLIVSQYAVI